MLFYQRVAVTFLINKSMNFAHIMKIFCPFFNLVSMSLTPSNKYQKNFDIFSRATGTLLSVKDEIRFCFSWHQALDTFSTLWAYLKIFHISSLLMSSENRPLIIKVGWDVYIASKWSELEIGVNKNSSTLRSYKSPCSSSTSTKIREDCVCNSTRDYFFILISTSLIVKVGQTTKSFIKKGNFARGFQEKNFLKMIHDTLPSNLENLQKTCQSRNIEKSFQQNKIYWPWNLRNPKISFKTWYSYSQSYECYMNPQ